MSRVRIGDVADAAAIAAVHVRSWRAVYRGIMPDEILDRLDVGERTAMWSRILSSPEADVIVVEDERQGIAGFCALIRARDADLDGSTGEVAAIYVDPERWRSGRGAALITEAHARAKRRGFVVLTLWVLEENQRARRFYEAVGFRPDGAERVEDEDGFAACEIRYRAELNGG